MLAEQVAEKERKKKEEEERRRQEEERDNERIRREQAAEEARLEARRQEDEAKKRALLEENERAAVAKQEDEAPGPLPPRKAPGRKSMRGTEDKEGFPRQSQTRSDLFGLPPGQQAPHAQPYHASPSSSPVPWEMPPGPVGPVGTLPQASFQSAAPGPASSPPVSDMLQGLMHQQQELYRHQQDALARLQEEADRLRQEKECARQDLLDMKARQLEEKEKDVKKLQRKLQRQMLLQSTGPAAPGQASLHMLPSVASTPVEGMSGMRGGFYSKYESDVQSAVAGTSWEEPGYPTDEELKKLREEASRVSAPSAPAPAPSAPSDPHAWPVAPLPWLQAEAAEAETADVAPALEHHEPAAGEALGEASLFEDSWGKPLENTAQLDERLGNTALSGKLRAETSQLEGTLVGESKFVQADFQGATMGATWIGAERAEREDKLRASTSLTNNLAVVQSPPLTMPVQSPVTEEGPETSEGINALAGSEGFAEYSLPKESRLSDREDPDDPLSLLQGAVNAIREARAEVACVTTSSFASPSEKMPYSAREEEAPSESWEGVLRQFGADDLQSSVTSKPTGRPPRRARQKSDDAGKAREAGYPGMECTQPELLSSVQPDSLDFLHGLGGLGAAAGTLGTISLDGLGTQRPIVKDDFAAFAAATPEDFDAFLSKLRAQTNHDGMDRTDRMQAKSSEGKESARGRQPPGGMATAKERAKFGSPTLRAAAGSLINQDHLRPTSGQSQVSGVSALSAGRPGSGGSACSLNSGAPASLRDLRHQRRKPKTTEDQAHDLPTGALPDAGPGTSLHATVPVSVSHEPSALQALREEHRGVGD